MNESSVRKTYRILGHKIGTHLRLLDPKGERRPRMLDVDGEEEFVRVCLEAGEDWHVYVGYNERISAGANGVISIGNVVLDIDPQLPGNEGTKYAIAAAETIARYVIAEKIHEYPLVACSGNGAYVWFCVPRVPPGDTSERQSLRLALRKFALYLGEKVADFPIKLDVQVTADIARIIRVIGTRNIKGRYVAVDAGLEARWSKMSFWLYEPRRYESELFWPFVENLKEKFKHKDADATHLLPVPAPGALDFFFNNCPRMASLAGRSNQMGSVSELDDYHLWMSFGVNLVLGCGQAGAAEWRRVSEFSSKFNPWDFDESNLSNKVLEAKKFKGPPNCSLLGCQRAGSPNCPKSPAGWAFRYAGALVTSAKKEGIQPYLMDDILMKALHDREYHWMQAVESSTSEDQRQHFEAIMTTNEMLFCGKTQHAG